MKRLTRFDFKKLTLLFTFGILLICAFPANSAIFAQQAQQQLQQQVIGVKITSPSTGQQVPAGEFTISGTSTDNATTDCTVYADWNNLKPFQKAIATGPGGVNDYSTWNFTYTADYHLITNGSTNELTSKLSCINNPTNLTKWYSVNVIGAVSDQNQQQQQVSTLGNTTTSGNVTASTTIAAGRENTSVRDVSPTPAVEEQQQQVSTLGNTTTSGNVTASTTIAAGRENTGVRDVSPTPAVEEKPSASTTDKNADPVKSPSPSSPVTSTTSSESKNTAKDKEDTTIKTINHIAQRVASTNPNTSPVQVQQILVQLAKQTAQTASKEQAIEEIRQIYSQVTIYPFGTVSQSLSNFAQQLASGDNVEYIIEQIIQQKARGKNISQSLVNIAVQLVCGGSG